jgi:transcriptional regulator with XRE-family HTH domain
MENNELKDRVVKIRKDAKLTQQKFADSLHLSRNFICQLEKGVYKASDRTIIEICKKYNVDKHWLVTGEGEPYINKTREDEIAEIFDNMQLDDEFSFKSRFISALAKLNTAEWKALERIVHEMASSGDANMLPSDNGDDADAPK